MKKYYHCLIVTVSLALAGIALPGCSNNSGTTVTTKPPAITVVTPGLHEVLTGGTQSYNITWTGTGITTQKTLEYSLNNGSNWILIVVLNADVNTYSWSVPAVASTSAVIRITDKNGLTGSSGTFTISLPVGSMDATVSGLGSFKATNATTIKSGSTVILKASLLQQNKNRDSVSISMIISTQGTPPYTIDVSKDDVSLMNYCQVSYPSGSCTNYQAKKGIGSGTITVTSLSPNIEGTFSGTLPQAGGGGTVTITGGAFKASLQ
jgi:hypothetical protein